MIEFRATEFPSVWTKGTAGKLTVWRRVLGPFRVQVVSLESDSPSPNANIMFGFYNQYERSRRVLADCDEALRECAERFVISYLERQRDNAARDLFRVRLCIQSDPLTT